MNTLEGNKLIAEFMKIIFHDDKGEYYDWEGLYMDESLRFHTSWDWLMQVVEKIESLETSDSQGFYSVEIDADGVKIYCTSPIDDYIAEVRNSTKLEATYQAVLQFIEWYNAQNKS